MRRMFPWISFLYWNCEMVDAVLNGRNCNLLISSCMIIVISLRFNEKITINRWFMYNYCYLSIASNGKVMKFNAINCVIIAKIAIICVHQLQFSAIFFTSVAKKILGPTSHSSLMNLPSTSQVTRDCKP